MDYEVELHVYQGPLDLLLSLIRRRQLDITTVALGEVTGQYLAYVDRLQAVGPRSMAAFCEVAAQLLLLKSRALLPGRRPQADDVEEEVAVELTERLRLYSQIRDAAQALSEREHSALRSYVRPPAPVTLPIRLDTSGLSTRHLAAAMEAVLMRRSTPAPTGQVPVPRVRVSDHVERIGRLLAQRGRLAFEDVLESRSRLHIIVSFVAVLEMVRRGLAKAWQTELFGTIWLETKP
jgi:segregation and condensation protein A